MLDFQSAHYRLIPNAPRLPRAPWLRRVALAFVLLLAALMAFPWVWRGLVELRYAPRTYTLDEYLAQTAPTAAQPAPRTALVFGARVYRDGRLSAMLRDRVDTAVALYSAGQLDRLIMTGGQNGEAYDEPAAMRDHAVANGVPPSAIVLDYGGLRTYDSCYRAAHVFDLNEALLVTQAFHLPRALLLCDQLGMEVIGVSADRRVYDPRSMRWSEARELVALVAALVDLVRRQPPQITEGLPQASSVHPVLHSVNDFRSNCTTAVKLRGLSGSSPLCMARA